MKKSAYSARTIRRKVQKSTAQCNDVFEGAHLIQPTFPTLHNIDQNTGSLPDTEDEECSLLIEQLSSEQSSNLENNIPKLTLENSSTDSSQDDTDDDEESRFHEKLANWSTTNNITHSALGGLLKLLNSHSCFKSLPKDARTLLKTPRTTITSLISDGEYVHFGLENAIRVLAKDLPNLEKKIQLYINIDGIPIFKSSSIQFWPILCSIVNPPSKPTTVGIFCGDKKSSSSSQYLSIFVNEALKLYTTGIIIGKTIHTIEVIGFICDAPARAYISGIKSHTGYSACGKCAIKGNYVAGRVIFNETNCELRTNQSFRSRSDETHHKEKSEIEKLPIDMVKCFPYEYMHLVCLGVTRKLLQLWCRGKKSYYRLTASKASIISSYLLDCRAYTPLEFNRKPRSLIELDRWKATEFRQFLLYNGVTALVQILDPDCYKHFLCLHVAISIFASPNITTTNFEYGSQRLKYFVSCFSDLYGEETISYNVHGLLHLPDDVKVHGSLDKFSGFKFENELQHIKRLIRGKCLPLQQIHRRIVERQNSIISTSLENKESDSFSSSVNNIYFPLLSAPFYRKFKINNSVLDVKSDRDNICALKSGIIIKVIEFCSVARTPGQVIYRKFETRQPLYKYPCDSSLLKIWKVNKFNLGALCAINKSELSHKCMTLPLKDDSLAVFPLLHSTI